MSGDDVGFEISSRAEEISRARAGEQHEKLVERCEGRAQAAELERSRL